MGHHVGMVGHQVGIVSQHGPEFTDTGRYRLFNFLHSNVHGIASFQKQKKIYLENPNLAYALSADPDKVALRETFLFNQLLNSGRTVTFPKQGDFLVDGKYTIEVGKKNKNYHQVKGIEEAYIAADDIEIGSGKKIPLWMFGLLY